MSAEQTIKTINIEETEGQTAVTLNGTKFEISGAGDVSAYTDIGVRAKALDKSVDEAAAPETAFRTDFNSVAVRSTTIEV